jgi:hypothetical protein
MILLSSCAYLTEDNIDSIATISNEAYWRYKTDVYVTSTNTPTETSTSTLTDTPTSTVTFTPTSTLTMTPTFTETSTLTNTPSNTPTNTPTVAPSLNTHYVSNSGNNANPGTLSEPWKTLQYAVTKIQAGDILYIRGGTYREVTSWNISGTETSPITIMNYQNEQVIIDGYDTIPANTGGTWMFMIWGDWYNVSGLEVIHSFDEGAIGVKGKHVVIDNCYVHHNWGAGITMMGDYGIAQNNRVWYNSISNEFGTNTRGGWSATLTCARYPQYCTLRGNTSWENWGEGISTFETYYATIEDNISYNNLQNFYVSDTKYTVMQRNISYCSPGNIVDPYSTQNGILVGDEKKNPASTDNMIINNLVYGCDRNLAIGTNESTNDLIANNTFVNADSTANVLFYGGTCTNCRFENNIILQETSISIDINGGTGWTFSNNLWSKTPSTKVIGTNDLIGNPFLLKSSDYTFHALYQLQVGSPAINKGLFLSTVPSDYYKFLRDNLHDIGAIEYH